MNLVVSCVLVLQHYWHQKKCPKFGLQRSTVTAYETSLKPFLPHAGAKTMRDPKYSKQRIGSAVFFFQMDSRREKGSQRL